MGQCNYHYSKAVGGSWGIVGKGDSSMSKAGVFIDRDGVINVNRSDYVKSWDDFVFESGIFEPLRCLAQNHLAIVVVSNQSAIGRGLVDRDTVDEIHSRMIEEITRNRGRIDGVYYCPHRPEDGCDCRKPRPGLLLRAAQELNLDLCRSYFIGDTISDVEAALAAGCMPLLVQTGLGTNQMPLLKEKGFERIRIFHNLKEVADFILGIEAR